MSTQVTPQRGPRRRDRDRNYSPPVMEDDGVGTPQPIKARINNLNGQVQELVRKQHATERKHRAEMLVVERRLEEREQQMVNLQIKLAENERSSTRIKAELERCKSEGNGMRDELNLFSLVQQQKALLAVSEERLQLLELEQRLVESEVGRVVRDHKISLFQSHEADMAAELTEKQSRIAELEEELASANTSLAHQRAAESKAKAMISSTQDEVRLEAAALAQKLAKAEEENKKLLAAQADKDESHAAEVETLQENYRKLLEKKRALKADLAEVNAERDRLAESGGDDSSEAAKDLRDQLRAAKAEARKKSDEAADIQFELEAAKEREKALLAKYQEAQKEKARLLGVAEELEALKSAAPKARGKKAAVPEPGSDEETTIKKKAAPRPKKKAAASPAKSDISEKPSSKTKVRKTSPADSADEDEDQPKSKAKRAKKVDKAESKAPLSESTAMNSVGSDDDTPKDNPPEKKKKMRKLFAAQPPAFSWDPILNSGDGVIPTYLSPVKPMGKAVGTIPRAGFSSLSSRRF